MDTEKLITNNQTAAEISVLMDEKEKQLITALNATATIEQEILLLSRQIITLQGQKKDLEYAESKARQNLRVLASEQRILKSQFWNAKNVGL